MVSSCVPNTKCVTCINKHSPVHSGWNWQLAAPRSRSWVRRAGFTFLTITTLPPSGGRLTNKHSTQLLTSWLLLHTVCIKAQAIIALGMVSLLLCTVYKYIKQSPFFLSSVLFFQFLFFLYVLLILSPTPFLPLCLRTASQWPTCHGTGAQASVHPVGPSTRPTSPCSHSSWATYGTTPWAMALSSSGTSWAPQVKSEFYLIVLVVARRNSDVIKAPYHYKLVIIGTHHKY